MGPGSVGPSSERPYTVQQLQVDWLEELPDGLLQQQVLQRLDAPERKALRCAHACMHSWPTCCEALLCLCSQQGKQQVFQVHVVGND